MPFDFWSKEEGGSDSAFSGYRNEEIVEISHAAQAETRPGRARPRSTRTSSASRWPRCPQIYLFHPSMIWATRDNVNGFAVFPTKAAPLLGDLEDAE